MFGRVFVVMFAYFIYKIVICLISIFGLSQSFYKNDTDNHHNYKNNN